VYSRAGRYPDAVRVYKEALERSPSDANLHLNLGLAFLKQDDHRRARASFERALAARPNHRQTVELLATTQIFTGDSKAAAERLEKLEADAGVLYLLSVAYLKLERKDDARGAIDRLFATLEPAQAHLLAGRAYYESTMFDEALAELQKARDLDSNLAGLWRELGKAHVSLRQSVEARQALERALRTDPSDAEAAYFRGALLVGEGEVERGAALLERTRKARPDFWGAWYYLGKAALTATEYASAGKLYSRAAELNPDEPAVLYGLTRALKGAGRDREARAIAEKLAKLRARSLNEAQEALVIK
jgi:tetratricopeptide (TPR) repeat protein